MLVNPDLNEHFHLLTDASLGGKSATGMIGWAVVQKDKNGNWAPISFGSRILKGAEVNYPINELEQLAVIVGYRDNYHLLYGHPTSIFVDNKPSVDKSVKREEMMLGRIQALVSDTSSGVYYREGKNHQVPDF